MESETLKTSNYYIEREGEKLKITLIDPRHKKYMCDSFLRQYNNC